MREAAEMLKTLFELLTNIDFAQKINPYMSLLSLLSHSLDNLASSPSGTVDVDILWAVSDDTSF